MLRLREYIGRYIHNWKERGNNDHPYFGHAVPILLIALEMIEAPYLAHFLQAVINVYVQQ
jgi:hypothetical protein